MVEVGAAVEPVLAFEVATADGEVRPANAIGVVREQGRPHTRRTSSEEDHDDGGGLRRPSEACLTIGPHPTPGWPWPKPFW